MATMLEKPENSWGFIQEDCWGYVPCIELAVCYDKLGMPYIAEQYNELASIFKSDDPSVKFNRNYFNSLRKGDAMGSEKAYESDAGGETKA